MVEYWERKCNSYSSPDFGDKYGIDSTSTANDMDLDEWELRVLTALKSSSKTEKRICKEIKLNTSIVSELITALIEKGLISSARKRRLFFYSSEYFSTTLE